jgi:hypothetical protein
MAKGKLILNIICSLTIYPWMGIMSHVFQNNSNIPTKIQMYLWILYCIVLYLLLLNLCRLFNI